MGSWNGNNSGTDGFLHHADAINDGGWFMIRMANVVDGWIRRCAFVNVVRPIIVSNTIAVSIYHCQTRLRHDCRLRPPSRSNNRARFDIRITLRITHDLQ